MGVPEEKWEKESAYIRNNGLKKKTQQLLKSEGRNEYTDTGSSLSLTFGSLVIIDLSLGLFGFITLEVHWASCICIFISSLSVYKK